MKKTEKILAVIAFTSIILSMNHVPFGGVISVLSFTILALLYMYLSFALFNKIPFTRILKKEAYLNISKLRIFGTVLTGMVLSLSLIGMLFKLQLYPMADINLLTGILGLLIAAIVSIIKYSIGKDKFYVDILKRIILIGVFGLLFTITPKKSILEIRHRKHPEYVEAVKKAWADPDNQALWKKVEEESLKIYKEK
ncbi:hypothetical protein [Marinifilum flexuosum]|uniref:hypothetical protein n=1 Tax=Marinifilum flexuosum TaxID=1117708 RepID=UPI002491D771|nr:hypothetical protein [Marinifilum flexuosum]